MSIKSYYQINRKKILENKRLDAIARPEFYRAMRHRAYMKSRGKRLKRCYNWRRIVRKEAIKQYGSKCECCGETTYEFMAFDHIHGGGNKHRRELKKMKGMDIAIWLKRNNWPIGIIRLLCHNCNCAISYYGHCPHALNS